MIIHRVVRRHASATVPTGQNRSRGQAYSRTQCHTGWLAVEATRRLSDHKADVGKGGKIQVPHSVGTFLPIQTVERAWACNGPVGISVTHDQGQE